MQQNVGVTAEMCSESQGLHSIALIVRKGEVQICNSVVLTDISSDIVSGTSNAMDEQAVYFSLAAIQQASCMEE